MEFKKTNRYDKMKPGLNVPPRRDTPNLDVRSSRQPTTSKNTVGTMPTTSPRHSYANKKNLIIAFSTVVVVLFVIALLARQHAASTSSTTSTPAYETILPDNESISQLGGWTRVSPPKNEPVYAYADTIGDIAITVSQQPLPKSFIDDIDNQVAELAKKFNATTEIDAASIKVYIGTSAKGPQSVIMTKNNLLILIKSQNKIDDKAWVKYVKSLD